MGYDSSIIYPIFQYYSSIISHLFHYNIPFLAENRDIQLDHSGLFVGPDLRSRKLHGLRFQGCLQIEKNTLKAGCERC
jgi:hypothetical protein